MDDSSKQFLSTVGTQVRQETERYFSIVQSQAAADDVWSARALDWLKCYCLRAGKGIRPALVLVGAAAAQDRPLEQVLADPQFTPALLLVEFLHKRLLMADDVADRDELRNDEPAYHVQLDEWLKTQPNYATLAEESRQHYARTYTEVSGIWLQQLVTEQLVALQSVLSADAWQQAAADVNRHAYQRTFAGWFTLMDQNLEPLNEEVDRGRFLRGIEMITSDYTFVSPLLLGSAFGTAQADLREKMVSFGHKIGVVFQLSDDVLGLYGDPAVTGKPVGGDIREGKKTLLMQEAFSRASMSNKLYLQSCLGNPDVSEADIQRIRDLVIESGSKQAVDQTIQEYVFEAQEVLEAWPHAETQALLQKLLLAFSHREK